MDSPKFYTSALVNVQPRTWAGINKPGGVGKVVDSYTQHETWFYDVKYVLGGKEKRIEERFLLPTDLFDPEKQQRQVKPRDFYSDDKENKKKEELKQVVGSHKTKPSIGADAGAEEVSRKSEDSSLSRSSTNTPTETKGLEGSEGPKEHRASQADREQEVNEGGAKDALIHSSTEGQKGRELPIVHSAGKNNSGQQIDTMVDLELQGQQQQNSKSEKAVPSSTQFTNQKESPLAPDNLPKPMKEVDASPPQEQPPAFQGREEPISLFRKRVSSLPIKMHVNVNVGRSWSREATPALSRDSKPSADGISTYSEGTNDTEKACGQGRNAENTSPRETMQIKRSLAFLSNSSNLVDTTVIRKKKKAKKSKTKPSSDSSSEMKARSSISSSSSFSFSSNTTPTRSPDSAEKQLRCFFSKHDTSKVSFVVLFLKHKQERMRLKNRFRRKLHTEVISRVYRYPKSKNESSLFRCLNLLSPGYRFCNRQWDAERKEQSTISHRPMKLEERSNYHFAHTDQDRRQYCAISADFRKLLDRLAARQAWERSLLLNGSLKYNVQRRKFDTGRSKRLNLLKL